jgi:hypothetical protein
MIAGIIALVGAILPAQEWAACTNRPDRFEVDLPGSPAIEDIKWPSESGAAEKMFD